MRIFKLSLIITSLLAVLLSACEVPGVGGGAKTASSAAATPADPNANAGSRVILAYLAALTLDTQPGVIVGQNTGHGNQILDPSGFFGYASLMGALTDQTGETPGMISLDYEHEHIFTPAQLSAANKVLIEHWQKGGLVTINWSPLNPWLNDESDLTYYPGVWTDTRTTGDHMKGVDLRLLLDRQSLLYTAWHRKLDRIAAALQELQAAGMVVLWRPMQEMNGSWFWWGINTSPDDPGPYVALWREMFAYFTEVKGLHNLLWVYSPAATFFDPLQQSIRPIDWAYPGDAYVDVVAGTAYNDKLDIGDYAAYLKFGKALGMAEFGPTLGGDAARTGSFDNTLRVSRLQTDYPAIAYFVAWHDWDNGDGTQEHQSIVGNKNAAAMLQDPSALTLSRLGWKTFQK
jgi:mannan endo-1,4-beta-mannosidase